MVRVMVRVDPSPRAIPATPCLPVLRSLAFLIPVLVILLSASPQEARWAQLSSQAEQLRQQGQINQAIPLAEQAVKVAAATFGPNDRRVGLSLDSLGLLYRSIDEFADADSCLRRALAILKAADGPQSKDAGAVLLNLADLYADHGRWGEAESDFREALTIAVRAYGQNDPHVADVLRDGGSLMIDEGKLEPAAHVLRGAIAIYTNAGPAYSAQLAATCNLAGQDVADAGDLKVAETLFQKAIDLSEKSEGPNSTNLANYLGNLANVYKDEQRFADGEPLNLRMIAILQHNYDLNNPILDEDDVNIGLFYYAWDKPDRAEPWFDRYIASRLAGWNADAWTMSEQDRLVYYATLPGTFPIYFSFITRYHGRNPALVGKMYDALLAERGLVAESSASSRARLLASGNRPALAILDNLAAERAQFAVLSTSASYNRAQIKQLSQQINQTEEALAQVSATFSQKKTLSTATWRDVQKALKPGEASVEITKFQFHNGRSFTANRIYVALVVTPRSQYPSLIVLGDAKQLEAAPLAGFRSVVAKTRGVSIEPTPAAPEAASGASPATSAANNVAGSAAYDAFWKPLEPALAGAQRVYVAADGVLNQIPIGLLSDSTGKLLLEKYQLRSVNSTRDLLHPPDAATAKSAVLLGNPGFDYVAAAPAPAPGSPPSASSRSVDLTGSPLPPLPGTEAEVTAVDKLLRQSGWQTTLYTGDRALKASIQDVRAPRVVHIATHGFFLEDHPAPDNSGREAHLRSASDDPMLHSGLFFAGANRTRSGAAPAAGADNGILTAYEASQLNLQGTELVVLSACETGLGEQSNSEGVFGLRRALQEAGASAVMMSMWSVPDQETQELMSLFYAKWLTGLDKPEALRQAQLQEREVVRKRYGKDLPFYWGAFVLVSR
jgi:CHAT domain-containing protein